MQSPNSLAIEPQVLREGLSYEHLEALRNEISDCPAIIVEISCCVALVRQVKYWQGLSLLENAAKRPPLVWAWIDPCGVMSTRMQNYYRSFLDAFEEIEHVLNIQTLEIR
jgi:hypothetical protein